MATLLFRGKKRLGHNFAAVITPGRRGRENECCNRLFSFQLLLKLFPDNSDVIFQPRPVLSWRNKMADQRIYR